MNANPLAASHLGEILTMIDRHAAVKPNNDGMRIPKALERWKPAKAARFKRMERHLRKLQGGAA